MHQVLSMVGNSPAYDRFISSMNLDRYSWADGVPYDLNAIDEMSSEERGRIGELLISQKDNDWRVTDALARLATPDAIAAIEQSTQGPNGEVRIHASKYLRSIGKLNDLTDVICWAFESDLTSGGWEAMQLVKEYPSKRVFQAVLGMAWRCATESRYETLMQLVEPFEVRRSTGFEEVFLGFMASQRARNRMEICVMCRRLGIDWKLVVPVSHQQKVKRQLCVFFFSLALFVVGLIVGFVSHPIR